MTLTLIILLGLIFIPLGIVCGINDDTKTTTTDTNEISHIKYQGIEYIEDFRALIELSVVNTFTTNAVLKEYFIDMLSVDYESIESFPFFLAFNLFEINKNYSQGDDVFI